MSRVQLLFGLLCILLGVVLVVGLMAGGAIWKLFCPAVLIALGGAVIARYLIGPREAPWDFKLIGDMRLTGDSLARDREVWMGIGDIHFDLRDTDLPPGETTYQLLGLIGDIELRVPQDVGLLVDASGFITDVKILGEKYGGILAPTHYTTPNYDSAERRVRLDAAHFIGDLKVKA
jgi:hypothetical protein